MKFLHMSDLHIGKTVNGFSMLAEQRRAFDQIIGCVRAERPAAVVIAGDVYDRAVPGIEAVRVFDDFLTELAGEDTAVLLVAGNHDSPERLSYASRLLSARRLYIQGKSGAPEKVTLDDEHGSVNFWLLPYMRWDTGQNPIEAADVDYSARNVLVSHQFYTRQGVTPTRSESELNPIGGLDAVDAGAIEKFDYAALGHLHGAQTVGAEHIRYAGSPVKYSFSEWRQKKSATLVELGEKGELAITALPLTPLHDMREIKGRLDALISGAAFAADSDDYLRVVLTDEEEIIDPIGKLRGVYPNVMSLGFENSRTSVDISAITNAELAEGADVISPYDLFAEFFLDTQGSAMSAEQAEIVRELLELAEIGGVEG